MLFLIFFLKFRFILFFFLLKIDWNSALFIILNGTKEEHLDMLDGGIIQRLLEEKWKTFARVSNKLFSCHKDMYKIKEENIYFFFTIV